MDLQNGYKINMISMVELTKGNQGLLYLTASLCLKDDFVV